MTAPLDGINVLELADGIAGPYAGRLLTMLGATVIKVEPAGGDPARRQQVDDVPLAAGETSPLYVHLNAGKRNVSASARPPLRWADVVIANRVRAQVVGTELDPDRLRRESGPLLVTTTAWGFDGEEPGVIADELAVLARSGCIAATGNVGAPPLRLPGWQAQYQAGATAAVMALAGLRMGEPVHLDVPWVAAVQVGMELEFADRLFAGRSRRPSGPFPAAGFPGGALPCSDGFVCPGSYRDIDWEMQTLFYEMPELYDDERFSSRAARSQRVEELWEIIRPWYASKTKREIFQYCLDSPWTNGMVMTGTDALHDPHLTERGLIGTIETPTGPVAGAVRPFLIEGLSVADHAVRDCGADDAWARANITEGQAAGGRDAEGNRSDGEQRGAPAGVGPSGASRPARERKPFDGLRMVEFSVAWAGPFVGNLFGALGMDVLRLEATRPFEGYRLMRLHPDSQPASHEHLRSSRDWLEASALFCAVNRNKRGVALDVSTEPGQEVFRDLVANADVVLCNFTARVMPSLGFTFEALSAINPGLVVVRMPAFGTTGPYSGCAGYALIVEAMGGFAARWGYEDEGARVSDTYWPDAVAGTHAALAVMTGIEQRDRTGRGCEIDFSHQDVMWCQMGESLVVASARGADIGRMGNREPGIAGSGIVATSDGGWEAVVGDRRERVVAPLDAAADPRLSWRFETVDRDVIGPVRELRPPVLVDGRPVPTRLAAPLFDQHTDMVLTEVAGYDAVRIAQLRDAKVVGGTLPDPKLATW